MRARTSGGEQRLTQADTTQLPNSWHPSGRWLAYHDGLPPAPQNIMLLPLEGDEASGWTPGEPELLVGDGQSRNVEAMFSPDGRWVAYLSMSLDGAGPYEVYVRPFPGPGRVVQVSGGGGVSPRWSRTRAELFYHVPAPGLAGQRQIMVVPYSVDGDSFLPERPRPWSEGYFAPPPVRQLSSTFDLHPDGDRFVVAPVPEARDDAYNTVVFVFNLVDELLARVRPR